MNTELAKEENLQKIGGEKSSRRPYYTVNGDKEKYEIRVFMPGVSKDHYQVSLQRDELLVEGNKDSSIPQDARWLHQEISTEDYRLRLKLNVDVEGEAVQAKSENGVLIIQLPVAKAARPRQIAIN